MTTDCEAVIEDYHTIIKVPILEQNHLLAAAQEQYYVLTWRHLWRQQLCPSFHFEILGTLLAKIQPPLW